MTKFVHLAPEHVGKKVRYGGIKTSRIFLHETGSLRGVYAMPVLPNFYASFQWLRELKSGGAKTIVGVYFHLPDDETVIVGHYGRRHQMMSAAQSEGFLRKLTDPRGYEVIIPHKIERQDIIKVRSLPQVLGWRHFPEAHGRKPCGCPLCWERGGIKSRKIRDDWLARERAFEEDLALQPAESFQSWIPSYDRKTEKQRRKRLFERAQLSNPESK